MSTWQLSCVSCNKKFHHSDVDETGVNGLFPIKPEFPEGRSELECPHCGTKAPYQRHQLTYNRQVSGLLSFRPKPTA